MYETGVWMYETEVWMYETDKWMYETDKWMYETEAWMYETEVWMYETGCTRLDVWINKPTRQQAYTYASSVCAGRVCTRLKQIHACTLQSQVWIFSLRLKSLYETEADPCVYSSVTSLYVCIFSLRLKSLYETEADPCLYSSVTSMDLQSALEESVRD
jgi:hypothetical protein